MSFDVQTVYHSLFFPQSPPSTENSGRGGISQRLKALTRDIAVKFPAHQVTLEPYKVDETNQMPIGTKQFYDIDVNEDHISYVKVTQAPSSQTGEDDQKQLTIDDLQDVLSALIDVANDWYALGLALRIKFTTLEGIDPKKKNSDKAHLREMPALWFQSCPSHTLRDLCNALRSETVQQDVLADTIERKYQGHEPNQVQIETEPKDYQGIGVEPPVYSNQVTLDGTDEPNQVQIETKPKDYQYQGINQHCHRQSRINYDHPWYYRYAFSNTLDSADEPKEIETEPKDLWKPRWRSYRHQVTLDQSDEPNQVQIETEPKDYQGIDRPWYYEDQVSAFKVTQAPSSQAGEDDQWNKKQLTIDDLQEVFSAVINAATDWFELGLAFKIKVSILEGIDSNKSKNSDKAHMREMLAHWLRSSPSRTWSGVCNALRSETVQQDVLADTIERKYQGMSRKKRKTSSM